MIALHGWITAEGAEYSRVLDDCRRRMEQAAALGSPYIVASPPQEVVDLNRAQRPVRGAARDRLGAWRHARMEFLGFVDGIKNVASAWAIASGTGDPRATVVADVFHMIRGGGSIDDLLTLAWRPSGLLPYQRPACRTRPANPKRRGPGHGRRRYRRLAASDCEPAHDQIPRAALTRAFNRRLWAEDPQAVVERGLARIRALVEGSS